MSELSRPAPLGGRGPVTRVVLWVGPVLVSTVVPFWVDIHSTFLASMVLPLTIKSLNSCRTTSMSVLFCTHSLRIWLAKPDKVIHVTPVKWTSLTATAHSDDWVHVSSGKKREVVVERPDPAAPGVLDNRKNGDWLRNRTAQPIVQDRPDGFEARGQHQL